MCVCVCGRGGGVGGWEKGRHSNFTPDRSAVDRFTSFPLYSFLPFCSLHSDILALLCGRARSLSPFPSSLPSLSVIFLFSLRSPSPVHAFPDVNPFTPPLPPSILNYKDTNIFLHGISSFHLGYLNPIGRIPLCQEYCSCILYFYCFRHCGKTESGAVRLITRSSPRLCCASSVSVSRGSFPRPILQDVFCLLLNRGAASFAL